MMTLEYLSPSDIDNGYQLSWSEAAQLTHSKQVELYNWCACEEQETFPYNDCPRGE